MTVEEEFAWCAKAVNTGDATLKAADCTVDDAGNVFATPVPTGLLLMVR